MVPLDRERTHVHTDSTHDGNDGLARMSMTKQTRLHHVKTNEATTNGSDEKILKHAHDCHDDKTMTRRTRQAPIQTDTSFTTKLSDSTADSTYTTIASTNIPYGPKITNTKSLTYAGLTLSG